jgi:predicted NodU family carbamoyl transferase
MTVRILGISACYHDSAAALLVDRVIVAAREERFSRKQHDYRFSGQAISCCLREAGISLVGFVPGTGPGYLVGRLLAGRSSLA